MNPAVVLTTVAEVVPDVLMRDVIEPFRRANRDRPDRARLGACLVATRVGIETLRFFGIGAVPLATEAVAGNAGWVEWMKLDAPGEMPEAAWAVSAGADSPGPGYSGHVVVEVTSLGIPTVLLDLDAQQFARPERGIDAPGAVLAPWTARGAGIDLDGGGVLIYRPHRSPARFTDAVDWRRSARHAGPAIRAVRARLNGDRPG